MRVDTAAKTVKNATEKAAIAAEKAVKSSERAAKASEKTEKAAEKAEANSAKRAAQSNAAKEASKAKNKGAAKEYVEYVGGNLLDYAVDKSVEYVDNDEKNHNKTEYDATVRGLQAREHIKKGKGKSKYKDAAVDTIKFVSDEMKRSKKDKKEKKQKDLYMSIYTVCKVLSKVGLDDNIDEVNSMSKKQRRTKLWKAFSKGPWLPYIPDVLKYISIMFLSTLCMINTIICHYGGRGFWTRPLQSEFWGSIIFYVILDICLIFYVYFSSLRAKKRPASLFGDLKRENMTFDEASEIFDSAKKIHMAIWNTDRYLFYIEYGTGHMISKEDIESIYIDNTSNGYILSIETKHGSFRRFSFEPFSLNRVKKIISE